jgi:hypothetical protein
MGVVSVARVCGVRIGPITRLFGRPDGGVGIVVGALKERVKSSAATSQSSLAPGTTTKSSPSSSYPIATR